MVAEVPGYDAPVSSQNDDLFDRWAFARRVYSVVGRAPSEWSLRVAIYGKWGEGKTSTLNFVKQMAESEGHVVLTISPWNADSNGAMWLMLTTALIEGLENKGVKLDRISVGKAKVAKLLRWLPNAKLLSEADAYATAAYGGLDLLRSLLQPDGEFLKKVREKIKNHRLIVIIDDLDRADPKIVPRLLLALREVLDIPGFSFLMAFDLDIVSEALSSYHEGFEAGHPFLEKIVDFPFFLPEATTRELSVLRKSEAEKYCPFVPKDVWDDVEDLLPTNPRKLKLLVRNVSCLSDEVARHDSNELDWETILIAQLVRLESEAFLRGFAELIVSENANEWIGLFGDDEERRNARSAAITGLLHKLNIDDAARRERLTFLAEKWHSRKLMLGHINIEYQAFLGERPHAITWKEFDVFFATWRSLQTAESVASWLERHAGLRGVSLNAAAKELFVAAIGLRTRQLSHAADAIDLDEQSRAATEAVLLLKVLEQLWELADSGKPFMAFDEMFERLFEQAAYWIHFNTNESDRNARQEEQRTLYRWTLSTKADAAILAAKIKPWDIFAMREESKKELAEGLFAQTEARLIKDALSLFEVSSGVRKMREPGKHDAIQYLVLDSGSRFWHAENHQVLLDILSKSASSAVIFHNAIELIQAIATNAENGSSVVRREKTRPLIQREAVMRAVWRAAVSRRSQFRFHNELRSMRQKLIDLGANGDWLPIPQWLEEVGARAAD